MIARLLPLLAAGLATWSSVYDYGRRALWGSVRTHEWVACAILVLVVCFRAARPEGGGATTGRQLRAWRVCGASAAVYAATYAFLGENTRMVVAVLGAVGVACAGILGRGALLPAATLGALSLPVLAILQLQVGFPLRVAGAHVCAFIAARATGADVSAQGSLIRWGEHAILVDEPCSGVRILWTALLTAAGLALWFRLSAPRSAGLIALGVVAALIAHVVRTVTLVFLESPLAAARNLPHSEAVHTWTGLASAAAAVAALALSAEALRTRVPLEASAAATQRQSQPPLPSCGPRIWTVVALLLAALMPFLADHGDRRGAEGRTPFPGWPTTFRGEPLSPTSPQPEDSLLALRLPGRLQRFETAEYTVVISWVTEPTPDLHSAAICFRGAGYDVVPASAVLDDDGGVWTRFNASRGAIEVKVEEQIRDEHGRTWSDLAAWWWAASLGRTEGPWWRTLAVKRGTSAFPEAR